MTPEEDLQAYIDQMETTQGFVVGADFGLHLQSWLEDQSSDQTGCLMIDSVFISEQL